MAALAVMWEARAADGRGADLLEWARARELSTGAGGATGATGAASAAGTGGVAGPRRRETFTAPGDRVLVRSGSAEVSYRVGSVEVLSRDELARRSADVFGQSGSSRLVLITCEDWDGTAYRSNVVVTAQQVG